MSCHRFEYVLPVLLFGPPLGVGILLPIEGGRAFAPEGPGFLKYWPPILPVKRKYRSLLQAHLVPVLNFISHFDSHDILSLND